MANDSRIITFSIYNSGFFGIFIAVIVSVASSDYRVIFGILVMLGCAGTLITTNSLMIVKWRNALRADKIMQSVGPFPETGSGAPTVERMLQFASEAAESPRVAVAPRNSGSTTAVAGSSADPPDAAVVSSKNYEAMYRESARTVKLLEKRVKRLEQLLIEREGEHSSTASRSHLPLRK